MATEVNVFGQIRGAVRQFFTSPQQPVMPALGDGGEQIVCEGLPPLTDIVRQGNSWQMLYTTAGVAAATALPTTTSLLTLTNLDAAKSYVIESFGTYEGVVDATQTDVTMILAMLNRKSSAVPSGGTVAAATMIQSLSGKSAYGGNGVIRSAATIVNDGWFPHQTLGAMAAAAAGANFKVNEVQARGLYVVPPGCSFNIQAVKAAAAAALQQFAFVRWHEVNLNLG